MLQEAKICELTSDNFKKIILIFFAAASSFFFQACAASSFNERIEKEKGDDNASVPFRLQKIENSSSDEKNITKDYYDDSYVEEESNEDIPKTSSPSLSSESILEKSIDEIPSKNFTSSEIEAIIQSVKKYLNTPYKYGAKTAKGMDCSGFILTVYSEALGIKLPRSARTQFNFGQKVSKENLTFGDLVFFNTSRKYKPGHVGIYLYDNFFVHSSSTAGVIVSSLDEDYYKKRYYGARRIRADGS